jgi:pimeloyl-ACP methyl ester carboxylesterase
MTPPVVFVHGAFCGGWAFAQFREAFEAQGFETHAPHLPHHEPGADLDRLAACGVRDYAAAIAAYVRELERPPVLVGHSLGGLVAQLVGALTPCAAIAVIGSSPPWGVTPTTFDEQGASLGLLFLGDYWRRPVMPDFSVAMRTTLDRLPREAARAAFSRFVPESGRAIFETVQWWLDHERSTAVQVEAISAPILTIAGGQDRVNSASTVRQIATRFAAGQARFVEFPEMSHWLIGEPEWPLVAQTVLEWLGEHRLAPPSLAQMEPRRKRRSSGAAGVIKAAAAPAAAR